MTSMIVTRPGGPPEPPRAAPSLSFGLLRAISFVSVLAVGGMLAWATPAAAQNRITETENKLYLAVDIDREHYASGWDADYSSRSFQIRSIPSSSAKPRVEIFYQELAPNYYFRTIKGPSEVVRTFNYFKGSPATPKGGERRHVGKAEFDYVLIDHRNRECAAFIDPDGQGGGDGQVSAGKSYITGYWCGPTGETLSTGDLAKIFDAIGVKDAGSPTPGLVSLDGRPTSTSRSGSGGSSAPAAKTASPDLGSGDAEARLKKAKDLFEKGLITQGEYDDIRRKILKDL